MLDMYKERKKCDFKPHAESYKTHKIEDHKSQKALSALMWKIATKRKSLVVVLSNYCSMYKFYSLLFYSLWTEFLYIKLILLFHFYKLWGIQCSQKQTADMTSPAWHICWLYIVS